MYVFFKKTFKNYKWTLLNDIKNCYDVTLLKTISILHSFDKLRSFFAMT